MFFIAKPSMVMSSRFVPNKRGIFLLENLSFSVVYFTLFDLFFFFLLYFNIDRSSITFIDIKSIKCEFGLFEKSKKELIEIIWSMIRQMFVYDKYN